MIIINYPHSFADVKQLIINQLLDMHSFRNSIVLTLLLTLGSWTMAVAGESATTTNTDLRIRIEKTDDSRKIQLVYQATNLQSVNIRVVDSEGFTLYQTRMRDEVNFLKTISFEKVPTGTYFIEVNTADGNFREPVVIQDELEALSFTVNPYREAGKYVLSVAGQKEVNVEVYDQNSQILFSGLVTLSPESGGKLFDLSQVWGDSATFKISTETTTAYHTVELP